MSCGDNPWDLINLMNNESCGVAVISIGELPAWPITQCGTAGYTGARGTWKWDAKSNTWAQEEVPPVNEIYSAPESTPLSSEAEQERLWNLLKQAAGG